MNIREAVHATRVGHYKLDTTKNKKNLSFIVDSVLSKKDYKKENTRIYYLVVNDEIVKIGGSSSRGGIKATLQFYTSGNTGSPSIRSYGINYLIHEAVESGAPVEVYCQWYESVKSRFQTISGEQEKLINLDHKAVESACLTEYLNTQKEFPKWNLQESNKKWPDNIHESWARRRATRKKKGES
jgi:hypothetical protein